MRLNVLIFQRWLSLRMFLFYYYFKSTLSTFTQLIFTRINFCEKIFKLFLFIFGRISFCEETYFRYFARINLTYFARNIFYLLRKPCVWDLKKAFSRLFRDLICTIQNLKIFTRMKFPRYQEGGGGAKRPPFQFFSCNFYKRRI